MKKRKVLIVGGGIGGLALAAQLKKRGITPVIIEKCKEWTTIGYLLIMYPNGMKVLDEIGAAKSVVKWGAEINGITAEDEKGKAVWKNDVHGIKKYGNLTEIAREDLHRALRNCNKDTDIRMDTTWTDLEEVADGVLVTFSNGKTEKFDLVVGADGISSQTREYVHQKKPNYSGLTFWVTWIPKQFEASHGPVYSLGKSKLVGMQHSHCAEKIAVLFLVSAKEHAIQHRDQSIKFLKDHFKDMGGSIPKILALMSDEPAQVFHHDDDEVHLRNWSRGRVVLLGDAAHATSPILGMGGSMALEDAHVLADELEKGQDIVTTLKNYKKRRMPRIHWVSKASRIIHWCVEARLPGFLNNAFYAVKVIILQYIFMPTIIRLLEKFLGKKI